MKQHASPKGIIYVLLSAIFFSSGGLLIKIIPWSSLSINGVRSILALLVIGSYMKISGKKFRINRYVLLGAVTNTIMSVTFVMATKMTSAANAIVLQFTEPLFVIILMWMIFKDKPGKDALITCLCAFAGIVCFFFDKLTMSGMIGNILAIVSGLAYAFVFLIKLFPDGDMESSLILSYVLNILIGMPSTMSETDFGMKVIITVIVLGIFQYSCAYIFLSKGLDLVSPVTASITSMLEPILNPIWVMIFYHETIGIMGLIGAVLVIGSATVYNVMSAKKDNKNGHTS